MWNRYHSNRIQCACWFVGQAGRWWDCFALDSGLGRLPVARSNWVDMVRTTNYRNDYQDPLGLVYDLDTAQSVLTSSDPNQIVLGAYRDTFAWRGAPTMDMGSGGPLGPGGPTDNFDPAFPAVLGRSGGNVFLCHDLRRWLLALD